MYKLLRFESENVIGFIAGMGKKKVTIDLSEYLDKSVIVAVGDNGVGKSTFLSLVLPWPTPTDGKDKFIVKGKEGKIIRTYIDDDQTKIITLCIYRPKIDGGHSKSCFLAIQKPGMEPIEMNPTGNVTSYLKLLEDYFGINKEFISFSTYTDAVNTIVRMTDSQRKDSVAMMTPNVKRFEVAYEILNEKYKKLRTLIQSVSNKILSLRDEESLESDYTRLTSELQQYTEEREERLRKMGKLEGRLKELTDGSSAEKMIEKYNRMVANLATFDIEIDRVYRALMKLYATLGIEPDKEGSITFSGIDKIQSTILRYEKKLTGVEAGISTHKTRINKIREELNKVENDIAETETLYYSIKSQDIHELEKTRKEYLEQLEGLRYTRVRDLYEHMSYDEVINFSRTVNMIDTMIRSLYEEYGDLLSRYLSSSDRSSFVRTTTERLTKLQSEIDIAIAKRDILYRKIVEREQYRQFQSILEQRPKDCSIDTCPFISNALKWAAVSSELDKMKAEYKDLGESIEHNESTIADENRVLSLESDVRKLFDYVREYKSLIAKYYGITDLDELWDAVAKGTWGTLLDIMKLKDIAAILSEKELYIKITTQNIPHLDHAIEMAKLHGTNRDLLLHQLDRYQHTRDILKAELDEHKAHLSLSKKNQSLYETLIATWRDVAAKVDRYRELISIQIDTQKDIAEQNEKLQKVQELADRIKQQRHSIEELDKLIVARNPKREQVKLDLDAVRRLKIEKLEIERDFTVINVIRSIVAPGKGIRKELIGIFMTEIQEVANQLLLNTFDGKLYLNEFIITDKEFVIPYTYNSNEAPDISYASSAQQATISSAISLAILSKMLDKMGIYAADELDGPLNPKAKREFLYILLNQMKYIGLTQAFLISQSADIYIPYQPLFICFPGAEITSKQADIIEVL